MTVSAAEKSMARFVLGLIFLGLLYTPFHATAALAADNGQRILELEARSRDTNGRPVITRTMVPAAAVAIVVTDVWSYHWCATCSQRFGAAVPRMNRAFAEARKLGLTILFTPSEAVSAYAGAPQRSGLASFTDVPLPPEQPFDPPRPPGEPGGCMCGLPFNCRVDYGEQAMHPELVIGPRDFICGSRQELYNVCRARGITHLIHAGFAANMCLWGKECGLISTARLGFKCLVARDLTDAFGGTTSGSEGLDRFTARVVEHIEQRVVPTIDLLEEMRRAGGAGELWVLDPVRIAPWGTTNRPVLFAKEVHVSFSLPAIRGAELRYTIDGRPPTADSPWYRGPLVFSETTLVRVAGFKDGQRVALDSEGYYCRLPAEPPLPGVYVSDLQWQQASLPGYAYWSGCLPWYGEGAPPPQKDCSYAKAPLQLRGVTYPKGVGVQAPARLLYELKPQYELFVARAGVDETMLRQQSGRARAGFPSVVFKVLFDGVLAAESPVMRMQQEPWRFQVAIPKGSRLMELVVTDAGDGPREELANWVNAGLVLPPENK